MAWAFRIPRPCLATCFAALLGEVEGWSEWVDLSATRHVPLASQGRWLGGLICPAGCDDKAARQDAMAHALALTLGVVRQRSYAEAVSEELAGASQLLADTREALAESRTFAALGDLAAGAGHELNTPLAVVSGRAQLMRERCEDPDQRRAWQVIADQAQRISDIISDLMEFASPKAPRPEPVDVRSCARFGGESVFFFGSSSSRLVQGRYRG